MRQQNVLHQQNRRVMVCLIIVAVVLFTAALCLMILR